MGIKVAFDSNNQPQQPTLVLMTKGGRKIGKLPAVNMQFRDVFNDHSEGRFDVYKKDCSTEVWDNTSDFKLIWARDWNEVYELTLDKKDSKGALSKSCQMSSLGEVELSQINLYEISINTEDDIARDDYVPTVLYNPEDPKGSLMDRLLEKAPHYKIAHVDESIAGIQRTFDSFDGKSIYDAFKEVGEKEDILFIFHCYVDDKGKLHREISAYDLESVCNDCGHRGSFGRVCEECGSENLTFGYGEDTSILVSSDNLAEDITLSIDTTSVKNCMRITAGDDLMTATVAACNPNGTNYIWYISSALKNDMSPELVTAIESYEVLYDEYQNTHEYTVDSTVVDNYNALITKYSEYEGFDKSEITSPIVGYASVMQDSYETIDFYYYLGHSFMPSPSMEPTTAEVEGAKLRSTLLENYENRVSVRNATALAALSVQTANGTIVQLAKSIVSPRYKVSIEGTSTLSAEKVWNGTVNLKNNANEDDTFSVALELTFDANYEAYVAQTLDRVLAPKENDVVTDISALFKLSNAEFAEELKKHSLSNLGIIHDSCQSCLDVLIQQGIADGVTWSDTLYQTLYLDGFLAKMDIIDAEVQLRETELGQIHDMMEALANMRNETHEILNLKNYLGDLWLEFVSYRREEDYQDDNYISDGLTDADLFKKAMELTADADKELMKSAEFQHSLSSTIKNLLVMKEFQPIVEHFEVGNWIRSKIDGELFRLRLLDFEVNFQSIQNLSVTFSDTVKLADRLLDIRGILARASSMASSYGNTRRKAIRGNESYNQQQDWKQNGMSTGDVPITSGG